MSAPERLPLEALLQTEDPAWPALRQWLAEASNSAGLLATDRPRGDQTLLALQVSLQTTLGAVGRYTGGVSVDGGWIRLLGAGGPRMQEGLREWNGLDGGRPALPGALIVAHDAVGGFYAVNGGAFAGAPGIVFALSSATASWVNLGVGYTAFLRWALSGDLDSFYGPQRWPGWRAEVAALSLDEALSVQPYPWLTPLSEAAPMARRRRQPAPLRVLWDLLIDAWSAGPSSPPVTPEA